MKCILTILLAAAELAGGQSNSVSEKAKTEPLPSAKPVPEMQAIPLPEKGISFQHQGRELTRLYAAPDQQRPFLFPMMAPCGVSLTRMGHPRDPVSHSHHNSVWISHFNIGDTNFWEDRTKPGAGKIVLQKIERLWDSADRCGCTMLNDWVQTGTPEVKILQERRTLEIWRPDAEGNWLLVIDIEFSTAAEQPVVIAETPFGPIGVRMAKTIGVNDGGGRILNSSGQRNEAECFRKPARWVDYSGPLTAKDFGGVALFDHPNNPNHPNAFHVRNDGWMGATLTFTGPLSVEREKPIKLRYGLWSHAGVPTQEAIEAQWKAFSILGESGGVDQVKK